MKRKILPFFEKNLKKNLEKNYKKFKFTNEINQLSKCDLIFISKDTPTNSLNKSNSSLIKKLIKKVTKNISKKSNLIILSQVPPGFTRSIKWNRNKLYYQVETLIFSQAQKRALNPERIIVGKYSKNINKRYLYYLKKFRCPIVEMNYESSELAKISINIFLISTLTSTNILSEICENLGANWHSISTALRLDKRIGRYAYLKPGLGLSGGNLERDLETLKKLLSFNKLYKNYTSNLIKISSYRKDWIYKNVKNILLDKIKKRRIGILGLTYKEGTNSTKNSPSISFINKIYSNSKLSLNVFDPVIKKINKSKKINFCKNENEVINKSDIIVIGTPWKEFKKIKLSKLLKKIIIDPYNHLNLPKNKNLKYISMGK